MENKSKTEKSREPLYVLLIGNNPIDMSGILEKLHQISGVNVITEIAFDVRSIVERLISFKPNYILIDDNIGKKELTQTINELTSRDKTKDIPIAVLKNSNYEEAYGSSSILDYLLKKTLTTESLYTMLKNSLKFKKTQHYRYMTSLRRKPDLGTIYSV